jgi:hypothetical protein
MRPFILGVRSGITKVKRCLIEAESEKGLGTLGMPLSRCVVRVALLVTVVAASFAAGMIVMKVSSRTGNHPLYFAIAALVAIGALLLAALLSYRVVDRLAGVASRLIR